MYRWSGHKAFQLLDNDSILNHLAVTNHALLPEIKKYEKILLKNSVIRYNTLAKI